MHKRFCFWQIQLPSEETPGGGGGGGSWGPGQGGGFFDGGQAPGTGGTGEGEQAPGQHPGAPPRESVFGRPIERRGPQQPQPGQQPGQPPGQFPQPRTGFPQQQPRGGQPGAQQQQAQAQALSDDTLVNHNGQVARWGDVRRQMETEHGTRTQQLAQSARQLESFRQELIKYAQQVQAAERGGQRPQQQQQAQLPELLNGVRQMAAVDGNTVAELMQHIHDQMVAPLARQNAQLTQQLTGMGQKFQTWEQQQQPLQEQHNNQQFDQLINGHLSQLSNMEIPGMQWRVDIRDQAAGVLREVAKDLFLSHQQHEWTPESFRKDLTDRIGQMVQFIRAGDKAYTGYMKNQSRQRFLGPLAAGAGAPSGAPGFVFQTGQDMARDLATQGFFDRPQHST